MNIAFEKTELIKRLGKVQDVSLLKAIKNLLDSGLNEQDDLNALEKSIDKALLQSESGEVKSHQKVMSEYRKRYES